MHLEHPIKSSLQLTERIDQVNVHQRRAAIPFLQGKGLIVMLDNRRFHVGIINDGCLVAKALGISRPPNGSETKIANFANSGFDAAISRETKYDFVAW